MDRLFNRTGLYLTIMLCFFGANIFTVGTAADQTSLLYPTIRVNQTEIGGLSIDAARTALLATNASQIQSAVIEVYHEDKRWTLTAKEIDLNIDEVITAQIAFTKPREGNILHRFTSLHSTHDIHPVVTLNADKLDNWLKGTAKLINTAAKSATIRENDAEITITPEVQGLELDLVNSAHAITDSILTGKSSAALVVRTIEPAIKASDMRHINGILASYQTSYNSNETARTQNIAIAASALNAVLLKPGEILSFNSIVGPRTQQRGYLKAPAFINSDELLEDWGGGICQVSTTLYNAALLANLTIIERSAHYRPVGYVPIGFDAAVDYDSHLDLKIKNTLTNPVYFLTDTNADKVQVRIYSEVSSDRPEIQLTTTNLTTIKPKTVIIQDLDLTAGKQVTIREGQNGFKVTTTRIRRINGNEYSEVLAVDTYKPIDEIIRFGAKAIGFSK